MMRIGFAKDIHKIVTGTSFILGGVEILTDNLGLLGHSDADVCLHALAESILGALALGDLGTHFPDNDMKNKDLDSKLIVKHALKLMNEESYKISNIDISIELESIKLKNYILKIRESIAEICNMNIKQISVKAMTNEGLDSVGRNESCVAYAICLLEEK